MRRSAVGGVGLGLSGYQTILVGFVFNLLLFIYYLFGG
jgi:hypothetical protein